jgi:hypothetical protein
MKIQYYGGPLDGESRDEAFEDLRPGSTILVPQLNAPRAKYRVLDVLPNGVRKASYVSEPMASGGLTA